MDKKCETCRHWWQWDSSHRIGECRHMPPKIIEVALAEEMRSGNGCGTDAVHECSLWPVTSNYAYCGMWTPKQEAQP